ncbi:23377_t:CDS:2 [Dentiscutata erythropus]|uniref:23377_t:CDS:1 n=1 Tax=Dentiscutata erythropus TaxID=1348616 RepID=A0A9N9CEJ0_9GLOM|nr:23377_t:CDS:2 [Dentiscutata erythropus]
MFVNISGTEGMHAYWGQLILKKELPEFLTSKEGHLIKQSWLITRDPRLSVLASKKKRDFDFNINNDSGTNVNRRLHTQKNDGSSVCEQKEIINEKAIALEATKFERNSNSR